MQLFHGGREQISAPPRAPAVAPSAVPSPRFKAEPRALTAAELRGLLDGYRAAARHCRDGGVDGIEVSMSHGYLIAQFFSPRTNRRADDHAAPLRFATEVLAAVREAAGPELAVGVRLSADELTPDGLDAGRCAEIAAALAATGLVDFASFVLGHSAYVPSSTWIVPPPPLPDDALEGPLARMRAAVDVPLIGTGGVDDARRRGAARGRRRGRRGRHDARADRRPDAGGQGGGGTRRGGARLRRLQPGLHRPLPRRRADRLPGQPAHRPRAHPARARRRRGAAAGRGRGRRPGGRRGRAGGGRPRGRR